MRYFLNITFVLLCFASYSQDSLNQHGHKKTIFTRLGITPLHDTIASEHNGFIFMPVFFFSPDTRLGFGGAGAYVFHLNDTNSNVKSRTSFVRFSGAYTINRQTDILSEWGVFTRSERFFLKGDMRFRIYPDRFYGVGNNSPQSNMEVYDYKLFNLRASGMKKLKDNLFAGATFHLNRSFDFHHDPSGILGNGSVTGFNGGTNVGMGALLIYDSRDNVLNSRKGIFLEMSSLFYSRLYGSSFNYQVFQLEFCKYWLLKPKHVLALQFRNRMSFGEVPFLELSMVGNDDILRGYPRNRFRDNHFLLTQLEYRFPLFWRFGMTTFIGMGDVFSRPQDLSWRSTKYTVGVGLRFLVNTAERINIRIDYGYGSEGGFVYINVAEAF
jgi:hypothetical protein